MFDIAQISILLNRHFVSSVHIRALQVVAEQDRPLKLLVATDEEVLVYDLRRRVLSYSLQAHLHSMFLFVLTEQHISM